MFFPKKAAALAAGFIAALSVATVAQNTPTRPRDPPRRWSSTTPRSTGSRSPTSRRSAKG